MEQHPLLHRSLRVDIFDVAAPLDSEAVEDVVEETDAKA